MAAPGDVSQRANPSITLMPGTESGTRQLSNRSESVEKQKQNGRGGGGAQGDRLRVCEWWVGGAEDISSLTTPNSGEEK